jgi:hypothetical protein
LSWYTLNNIFSFWIWKIWKFIKTPHFFALYTFLSWWIIMDNVYRGWYSHIYHGQEGGDKVVETEWQPYQSAYFAQFSWRNQFQNPKAFYFTSALPLINPPCQTAHKASEKEVSNIPWETGLWCLVLLLSKLCVTPALNNFCHSQTDRSEVFSLASNWTLDKKDTTNKEKSWWELIF